MATNAFVFCQINDEARIDSLEIANFSFSEKQGGLDSLNVLDFELPTKVEEQDLSQFNFSEFEEEPVELDLQGSKKVDVSESVSMQTQSLIDSPPEKQGGLDSLNVLDFELPTKVEEQNLSEFNFSEFEEEPVELDLQGNKKVDVDFSGSISMQNQFFMDSPIYYLQESYYTMLTFSPRLDLTFGKKKNQKIVANLNANLASSDDNRTYIDFPELYYQLKLDKHEFLIGSNVEFWGVTEIRNPTNIINQQDFLKTPTGIERLGQPMVKYKGDLKLGVLEVYYLPYVRTRQFNGSEGRFRPFFPVSNEPVFYNDNKEWSPSFAARISNTIGPFDIGLSYFKGIDNNPLISFDLANLKVEQQYLETENLGVELLSSFGSYSLKYEAIFRDRIDVSFSEQVFGLERSFTNLFGTGVNALLIGEYVRNNFPNGEDQGILLNNDIALGLRLDINDPNNTNITLGGTYDLDNYGKIFNISASSRVFKTWVLTIDSVILKELAPFKVVNNQVISFLEQNEFFNDNIELQDNVRDIEILELLFPIRRDSFFNITISKYF